jgi:hypothetical protein
MRARLGHATAAVVLSGVLLVLVPGPASAAQGGTDRPLRSDGDVTTVLNLCAFPLSGTIEGSFRGCHQLSGGPGSSCAVFW